MANLSNANGTIEVKTKLPNQKFWEALEATQEKCDYRFEIYSDIDESTVCFDGTGRWSFAYNLECFPAWCNSALKRTGNADARKVLEEADWELIFSYTDEEGGNAILYEETDVITHKAGTPITECKVEKAEESNYRYNGYCLCELDIYDNIVSAIVRGDDTYCNEDGEFLTECLDEERERIEMELEDSILSFSMIVLLGILKRRKNLLSIILRSLPRHFLFQK